MKGSFKEHKVIGEITLNRKRLIAKFVTVSPDNFIIRETNNTIPTYLKKDNSSHSPDFKHLKNF